MKLPRLARGIVLLLAVVLGAGCRSHEAVIAGVESADPEERWSALLALDEDGRNQDLVDRARLHANENEKSVPVRLVALRVLTHCARAGVDVAEVAGILSEEARSDHELWCRIEAVEDLSLLLERPTNGIVDETLREKVIARLCDRIKMESEPERDVRIHAARELALRHPDDRRVLNELVGALSDETPDVRYHAQRALIAIAGEDHGPTKADWKRWADNWSEGPR